VVTVNVPGIPAVNVVLLTLVMDGGVPVTVSVAVLLAVPVPPSVELIVLVVLFSVPVAVAVTLMLIAHELPAATVPAVNATLLLPALAVAVPPHVLLKPLGVETINPLGSVSVKAMSVRPTVAFGLLIVKLRPVLALSRIDDAPKALVMVCRNMRLRQNSAASGVRQGPFPFRRFPA